MSSHQYDLGQWVQDLAFWPAEVEVAGMHPRQLLVQRCGELLAHLVRWERQEGNRCPLWHRLIELQRRRLAHMLRINPQMQDMLAAAECLQEAWLDALLKIIGEANCFDMPDICPWSVEQLLNATFYPGGDDNYLV